MRRRGPIFGGGFFFIGFILIGSLMDLFGSIYYIISSILPLAVIAYLIYTFVLGKPKSSPKQTYRPQNNNQTQNFNIKQSVDTQSLNNGELNKIDRKLESYFKKNVNLPIVDGISLTTSNGKFLTAEQLYLTYKDEKIIKLNEFKRNNLSVYNKIMKLLLVFANQKDEVIKQEVVSEVKKEDVLSDAEKYIEKIDDLNKAIPQEEITNGLYQTCDLLKHIDVLKETTNDKSKIEKLYDYYLPILTNILEEYKKLQDAPVHGEEFKNCEAQLIKTIVLINEALKAICSSMQEDDYMNINADINTLQSLLQKDGYGNNPFKGDEK